MRTFKIITNLKVKYINTDTDTYISDRINKSYNYIMKGKVSL